MNQAVFISDLHLHPQRPDIFEKFQAFIAWASKNTQSVYILGDFIHAWPGDEAMDDWSAGITALLAGLVSNGIPVYFMPGNRDFLLGPRFLSQAKMICLADPTVITLGHERVLLAHGDQYCTNDWSHQWLRALTRNAFFSRFFLTIPYKLRANLVSKVRKHSSYKTKHSKLSMGIVAKDLLADLKRYHVTTIIHGHTHQPGLILHTGDNGDLKQYILSDWDENPTVLCYNKAKYIFSNI